MKPSTHKRIKSIKSSLRNTYYKAVYPLAWVIDKVEKYKYKRLKLNATPEYVAKLLSKDIYKYICKSSYGNDVYVVIADYVNRENYIDPYRAIEYFTKFKSKARKVGRVLERRDVNEDFFKLVMEEFNKINIYTFVNIVDKHKQDKWDIKGYKYTYHFGVKENKVIE
ncbi:hypothetical protein ACQKNX_07980 [Lysinibacillus sp. NPDC093712]|uniref:hypothetical protein n=1 Tax=Lysinibacillus sp. NPDC093712 TaxID=3390579 RepID=UPI003CFF4640